MAPTAEHASDSHLQLHHLADSDNQVEGLHSSSAWMGNKSSASSSIVSSTSDPADRIKVWKGQIRDYIQTHGVKYDQHDLVRRLLPITKSLAAALVHSDPLIVQEGFEFITSVTTEVGLEAVRPLLTSTIAHVLVDTKCSRSQCISCVARFASFDVVCIAECFMSQIHRNGHLRQMYYHVLRTIVDGPSTLARMEVDQYATLLFLLLECLENFRDPLRQQIAVVMQIALDYDQLDVVWRSRWDAAMKRRCMAVMPDCRRIAKLWARDNYRPPPPQRPPPAAHRPARPAQPPPSPRRRLFTGIGKTLDDSDLSSICFQDDDDGAKGQSQPVCRVEPNNPTPAQPSHHRASDNGLLPRESPVSPPHPRRNDAPTRPATRPSSTSVPAPHAGAPLAPPTAPLPSASSSPTPAFTPASWTTQGSTRWRQFYHAGGVMWSVVVLSVVFAIAGVAHAVVAYSHDFEAWKVRIALSDYQASLDRAERDIQRVAWRVEALTREIVDPVASVAAAWEQDHKTARAISSAWRAIQNGVSNDQDTSAQP